MFIVNLHGLFFKQQKWYDNYKSFLNRSNSKPNKIWVDKGSRFYNRLMKSCFQDNYIEHYLTFNEEK